eukprot:scaffold11039_cov96-Skeletonema_dohrnii-CCMP3373.AAC.2
MASKMALAVQLLLLVVLFLSASSFSPTCSPSHRERRCLTSFKSNSHTSNQTFPFRVRQVMVIKAIMMMHLG